DELRSRYHARALALVQAVSSDATSDAVLSAWQQVCEPDVQRAERFAREYRSLPHGSMTRPNPGRPAYVTAGASDAPDQAPLIDIALTVDRNLSAQVPVVLESIVTSTSTPIRVYMLTRGLGADYYSRLESSFDSVQFHFYPLDDVSFGDSI